MANIKSQIKRNRQNEKRHARNKAVRSELKTRVKVARQAIDGGADARQPGSAWPRSASTRPAPWAGSTRTRPPVAPRAS